MSLVLLPADLGLTACAAMSMMSVLDHAASPELPRAPAATRQQWLTVAPAASCAMGNKGGCWQVADQADCVFYGM